jgi:DNA-directed RNA polymerase specialized sigma24 family protein
MNIRENPCMGEPVDPGVIAAWPITSTVTTLDDLGPVPSPSSFETWMFWFKKNKYSEYHRQLSHSYPLDAHEIDGLMNTAHLHVFQHFADLKEPLVYFRTVLKHEIWRYLRRRRNTQHQLEAYACQQHREALLAACTKTAVAAVLEQLPCRERRLVLWHIVGYSDTQVAHWLGTTREAIRQARVKAYRIVRGRVEQGEGYSRVATCSRA